MNEYVIINKTALEKELKRLAQISPLERFCYDGMIECEERILKKVLSQSTPLIPEIEKAINSGIRSFESNAYEMPELIKEIQQDYISNLKLDI